MIFRQIKDARNLNLVAYKSAAIGPPHELKSVTKGGQKWK